MEWFRFYHNALNDPKVQDLPPHLFKFWVNVLCVASLENERGRLPAAENIAYATRTRSDQCASMLRKLHVTGLLEGPLRGRMKVHNWTSRQYKSDDPTPRVKRFRNVSVTATETPPEAEQRSERSEQSRSPGNVSPPQGKSPDRGRTAGQEKSDAVSGKPLGADLSMKFLRAPPLNLPAMCNETFGKCPTDWLPKLDAMKRSYGTEEITNGFEEARDNSARSIAYVEKVLISRRERQERNGEAPLAARSASVLKTLSAAEATRLRAEGRAGKAAGA